MKRNQAEQMNRIISQIVHIAFCILLSIGFAGVAHADQEAAERHMARGTAALEIAEGPADFNDAVKEFREAVRLAPDWADAWFNLGVAQEKAEDYPGAIASLKTYLQKNANADDRKAVERRIFGLEYKQERQGRHDTDASKRDAPNVTGTWRQHGSDGYLDYRLEISGQQTVTGRCIDQLVEGGNLPAALICKIANIPMYFHSTITKDGFKGKWSPTPFGLCSHIKEKLPIEGRISSDGTKLTITYQHKSFAQDARIGSCIPSVLRGQHATETWTRLR